MPFFNKECSGWLLLGRVRVFARVLSSPACMCGGATIYFWEGFDRGSFIFSVFGVFVDA